MAIDNTTAITYTSATNLYLAFCKLHNLLIDPTLKTLGYYITFQSAHINPKSVESYLSGICNQLEPFYPQVRKNRLSPLVTRTLTGAKRYHGVPTNRKAPLSVADLIQVSNDLASSSTHDDLLFEAQLSSGFVGLLRLGEMTFPDKIGDRDYRKVTFRHSLQWLPHAFAFWLPSHKADIFFEGNCIIIKKAIGAPDPVPAMKKYVVSRDKFFPLHAELWLLANGSIPTRGWFIRRLRKYFASDVAGQSLRSGSATALAEAGAPPELIKGAGRWSSQAFERYIRKNPIILHALILARSYHYDISVR